MNNRKCLMMVIMMMVNLVFICGLFNYFFCSSTYIASHNRIIYLFAVYLTTLSVTQILGAEIIIINEERVGNYIEGSGRGLM
jgi:hypothetical protein